MTLAEEIARVAAEQSNVDAALIATFVKQDGVQAVVDVGTARVKIPTLGLYFPVANDLVRLLRIDKQLFLLGPAQPRSPIGRVSATGSPRCTVEYPAGSGVTKQMGYPSNITPAVNDVVLIDWASGGTIVDKITVAPQTTEPLNPGGGAGAVQVQVFSAIDSGSFYVPGNRWATPEVWSSSTGTNRGAWFYGTTIKDTIPDTATILAIEIFLPLFYNQGAAPQARAHTSATRPGGNVAVTGATQALDPRDGWSGLPTSIGDYLKANDGGIALVGGGFMKYRGVDTDGQSGALRITYRT